MIIKSISGRILFKSMHKTVRASLESAIAKGVDLSYADLRKANLVNASLDGLRAPHACFWGADLCGADIGLASMPGCDLRCADLSDACFAETNLAGTDASGAYFSRTIFDGSILDGMKVSCPSFWGIDLCNAASMKGMIYTHLGEADIVLERTPIVINGLGRLLVLTGDQCLWGNDLLGDLRNPKKPIPKIQ